MTTQPTTKAQNALDWLCWVLITFGALCLVASVPQTFTMVRVAHDEFGSAILVVVLEVMAFFALLAPLWVPAWTKTFDRIAYVLLGITTLGNYAGGWNYVWTHSEVGPFWLSIRDWREPIFSLPLATILLVGALSGLVPFAMKFFISLAIKRYRENELDRSPEAVAQRAIEPVLVQIIATRRLQEQLMGLTEQFSNQPLVLPGSADTSFDRMRADAAHEEVIELRRKLAKLEGEQRLPFEPLGLSANELAMVTQAVQKAQNGVDRWQSEATAAQAEHIDRLMMENGGYTEAELNCKGCFGPCGQCEDLDQPDWDGAVEEPSQATTEASDENDWEQDWEEEAEEPMTMAEAVEELERYGWERLSWEALELLGEREEAIAEVERRRIGRERLQQAALRFGRNIGLLPPEDVPANPAQEAAGVPLEQNPTDGMVGAAEPLLGASGGAVASWECAGCGDEGSNGSKGVAKKWSTARGLGDKLYCKTCRDSGLYGK